MAIGICPECRQRFVIEDARSFQRTCPTCLRPMELADSTLESPAAAAGSGAELLEFNAAPLAADELGQRVMTAIAEAAYQQSVARAQRQAARQRRGETTAEEESPPAPFLTPGRPQAPLRGPEQPTEPVRQRAAALIELARRSCLEAKIVHGHSRVIRESRRLRQDELALLPPLDYWLPPLDVSLRALAGEAVLMPPQPAEPPLALPCTTLYVWGYEPPRSLLCRERCEASPAAAAFAAKAGWDAGRAGAWARSITVLGGLRETLRALEPTLRQDPAVVGWGARAQRRGRPGRQ